MAAIILQILQVIYLMLPGIFANMAPVLVKRVPILAYPLDHNRKFGGKSLLGSHKTYRGLFSAVIFSILVSWLQRYLYQYSFFKDLSLINYTTTSIVLWGLLIGLGVIIGDAAESFFKRRKKIAPGKPWFPWDQIDSVLGGLVFIAPIYLAPLWIWATSITLSLVLHVSIRHVAFYLGINKKKW